MEEILTMDKYQLNFLKGIVIGVESEGKPEKFEFNNDGDLVVTQNENYNITNYLLKLKSKDFSSVAYYIREWNKIKLNKTEISIPINFDNPTTKIKINLKNGLVDDFEFKIILVPADKAAWDDKYKKLIHEERLKNVELVLNSNESLHTVIFKPCCEEYAYSIVKWFAISKIVQIGGNYNFPKSKPMSKTFMEECRVENKFYCNNESAFIVSVEITQYDKNGIELITVTNN
jgi:hypothetical protein